MALLVLQVVTPLHLLLTALNNSLVRGVNGSIARPLVLL